MPDTELSQRIIGNISLDNQGSITAVDYATGYVLVRYDSDGKLLWSDVVQKTETGLDSLKRICVDCSGNMYIVGIKFKDVNKYLYDCVLVKFDGSGRQVWNTLYRGLGTYNELRDIKVDKDGNTYLLCLSQNADRYSEYATIKYDLEGDKLWERRYSPPYGGGDPRGMAIDKRGNIYLTGSPSTIKYDSHGNELWSIEEEGRCLTLDDQGNVDIACNSILGRYVTLDTVKLGVNGNVLWRAQYSKIWSMDHFSLITDSTGNVYIISSLSRTTEERNIK